MNNNKIYASLIAQLNAAAQIETTKAIIPADASADLNLSQCDLKVKLRLGADSLTITYDSHGNIVKIKIRADCSIEKMQRISRLLEIKSLL